jgi:hypothetical protein
LTAGGDSHIPADQEGQSPEHLFLSESLLTLQQFAQSFRQRLVIGHKPNRTGAAVGSSLAS